jgi:hypothetical protein
VPKVRRRYSDVAADTLYDLQAPPSIKFLPKSLPTKPKALPTVRDHTTDLLNPAGDEYIPREIDRAGEKKVALTGHVLDGREYRCRVFLIPNRGEKLFMLATECARVLGYRDSYLLFNKNRSLFKIIATQEEKDDLIYQEILPFSYRSRQIAIVTARSMFRQFGSRLIVNGRRVRDDYWESKARKQGFTDEDAAGEKRPGAAKAREAAASEANHAIAMTFAHPGAYTSNNEDCLGAAINSLQPFRGLNSSPGSLPTMGTEARTGTFLQPRDYSGIQRHHEQPVGRGDVSQATHHVTTPSFEEHEFARHGVLETMAPVGIPPPAKAKQRTRAMGKAAAHNADSHRGNADFGDEVGSAPASSVDEQAKHHMAHNLPLDEDSVHDIPLQSTSILLKPVWRNSDFPEVGDEGTLVHEFSTHNRPTSLQPAPSDSGYRSGKGTNTLSICSEQSMGSTFGLSRDFLQEFIAFFTDTLIEKAGARQWAQYARAHHSSEFMERWLTTGLKTFAIGINTTLSNPESLDSARIARESPNSRQNRAVLNRATGLVRRYRPKIARYFLENSLALPVSPVSLSERLLGLGQHLSLSERINLLSKNGANDRSTLETPLNDEDDDIIDDDVDRELLSALSSIQDVLVSSDAFQQLAAELGRIFYRNDTKEMETIRTIVSSNLDSCTYREELKAHFRVDWDILAFMYSQYGNTVPVASVVVLTGSAFYAQATTCGEYIQKNWHTTGPVFLELLERALTTTGEKIITKSSLFPSPYHLSRYIDGAIDLGDCFPEVQMCVRFEAGLVLSVKEASNRVIAELAQILAWIGSALSSSQFGKELAYVKSSVAVTRQVHDSTAVHKEVSDDMDFDITFEHNRLHPTENACWLPLFAGSSIASGFPIPDRAEEVGLEIPLELLAGIAGVYHATEFEGGLVMKGFCHMFVPVQKSDDRVQWHAITSQNSETRLTYQDALSRCKSRALTQEVSFDDLRSTRAFLGWCSIATSRLGSDAANFANIDYSGAQDASSSLQFNGCQVGFQQWMTAAANFSIGVNQGKLYRRSSGPYHKILSVAEKTPVVLYDTHEQRGWLVRATDVILHMIQHQHHLEPFETNGKRAHLDTNVPAGSSAKSVLLRNEKLVLSDDASDTFKHTVARIWSTLEDLIDKNVMRGQDVQGTPVKGTFRDFLQGYEFKAIVEERGIYTLKEKELSKTHGGWPLLARDIDALVLLADGFGEVILPADEDKSRICTLWQRMPSGCDYLATTSKILIELYNIAGRRCERKYLTSTQLQWHQGASQLFDECKDTKACQCNRLQQIIPKSHIGTIIRPEVIIDEGAVIFGHSGSLLTDLLSKPRPGIVKESGIYHHQNRALAPVDISGSFEDTCSSDNTVQSGSDSTAVSIPTSLSTCATKSEKEVITNTPERDVVPISLLLPNQCTLLPKLPLVGFDGHRQGLEVSERARLKRKKNFGNDCADAVKARLVAGKRSSNQA